MRDEKLERYKRKLAGKNGSIGRKVLKVLAGESKKEVLMRISVKKVAALYAELLDGRERGVVSIQITENSLKHLYGRGHLTGEGKKGHNDLGPLSVKDWERLPKVFLEPDRIVILKDRLTLEKKFHRFRLHLVLTRTKNMRRCVIVTYYHKTKMAPRLGGQSWRHSDLVF